MSDELDRRAALAMGSEFDKRVRWLYNTWEDDEIVTKETIKWHPSTDRNDLAELLREVERRGIVATYNMSTRVRDLWSADESILANQYFFALTADPAVICEAACKVLEEK